MKLNLFLRFYSLFRHRGNSMLVSLKLAMHRVSDPYR